MVDYWGWTGRIYSFGTSYPRYFFVQMVLDSVVGTVSDGRFSIGFSRCCSFNDFAKFAKLNAGWVNAGSFLQID